MNLLFLRNDALCCLKFGNTSGLLLKFLQYFWVVTITCPKYSGTMTIKVYKPIPRGHGTITEEQKSNRLLRRNLFEYIYIYICYIFRIIYGNYLDFQFTAMFLSDGLLLKLDRTQPTFIVECNFCDFLD